MKFGRMSDISRVNWELPADDERSQQVLLNSEQLTEPRIYVGCPIWANKSWVGKLYPPGTQSKDYLYHYAQAFNSIELNSSHYHLPSRETVQRWCQAVTPGFCFSPKIPQEISHHKILQGVERELQVFVETVKGLGENLGLSFLQLPPQFSLAQSHHLKSFLEKWPQELSLAVEFRHESWFVQQSLVAQAFDLLQKHGVSCVISDTAGHRELVHASLTSSQQVIRFVGNQLHETDYARIDEWIFRIQSWFEQGLNELYFFLHEPDDALAPEIAVYFIEQLNERCGTSLYVPSLEAPGTQRDLLTDL